MSKEVICLPIYPDLDHRDVERVIKILRVSWNLLSCNLIFCSIVGVFNWRIQWVNLFFMITS